MVWVYTLTGNVGNTVQFTACASTGASCTSVSGTSRTSTSFTSSAVSVASGLSCGLTAAITNNPACLFTGGTATFVMTVTNTTGNNGRQCSAFSLDPCGFRCNNRNNLGSNSLLYCEYFEQRQWNLYLDRADNG